jgi:hypothetical protein
VLICVWHPGGLTEEKNDQKGEKTNDALVHDKPSGFFFL